MNNGTQQADDFSDIAQPVPASDDLSGIATAAPDYARFAANAKINAKGEGEGTYTMRSPEGQFVKIPYSNVLPAWKSGFKIDPDDRETFGNDLYADLKKKNPHTQRSALVLPEAFPAAFAAPDKWSRGWWKQQALQGVRTGADLLPVVGGMVGEMAGAGAGVPSGPGAIAAAAGGAALGGAFGEGARRVINNKVFNEPTRTPQEMAKAMAAQAALQGVTVGAARVAAAPLKAGWKYLSETAMESNRAGIRLMPSEAHGKPPSWAEKFLKGSVFTSGMMERFRTAQNAESKAAVDGLANQIATFTGTPEDLGNLVQKGIQQHIDGFRATQRTLYDTIDRATVAGNVRPSMLGLKQFATQALADLSAEEQVVDPALLSSTRHMLENIVKSPNDVTFSAMADARSSLLTIVRDQSETLSGKRGGFAKKLAGLADQSMMDAANNSGIPWLSKAVRDANEFTRTEHERFEQGLVAGVVKSKKPEAIASLLRKSNIGIEETRDLFKVLPPDLHAPVQRQVVLDAAMEATDKTTGVFKERVFAKKIDALGEERGRAIFGTNWGNVKKLSEVMGHISGPTGMGSSASLQNYAIFRGMVTTAAATLGATTAVTQGEVGFAPLAAAGAAGAALGTEAGFLRSLAWAMTHPETAAKVLKVATILTRGARIAAPSVPALAQAAREGREQKKREREKAQEQEAGGNMGAAPPSEPDVYTGIGGTQPQLSAEAQQRNPSSPANQANKTYRQTATSRNGHKIGTDDGVQWFDVQTGQRVK